MTAIAFLPTSEDPLKFDRMTIALCTLESQRDDLTTNSMPS